MKIAKYFRNKQVIFLISLAALFLFLASSLMVPSFDSPVSVNSREKYLEDDGSGLKERETPTSSGFWVLNNITIDDTAPYVYGSVTWQVANDTYDWCDGKGTLAEPYVIEDVKINAGSSPTGNGILIQDSNDACFVIRNCTVFNPDLGTYPNDVYGCIKMINASKGQLYSNTLYSNTGSGVHKAGISAYQCANLTIVNNTLNGNGIDTGNTFGVFMRYSNETLIFNNSANSNFHVGIFLQEDCHYNNITKNRASYSAQDHGIALYNRSNNNKIINNTANNNYYCGIYLYDNCENNTIEGNTASNNNPHGIYLYDNCNNNTITGNTASDNDQYGIYLDSYCNYNTIAGNNASDNDYGINLYPYCNNNTIVGNTASNNDLYGIYLLDHCNNNTIEGNNASKNQFGITLEYYSNYNTIAGNNASDNDYGIYLWKSNNNTIEGNNVSNNDLYGIDLEYSNNNTIVGNLIINNIVIGIYIEGIGGYNNGSLIYLNYLYGNGLHASDDGSYNRWDNGAIGNYWDNYTSVDPDNDGIGATPYTFIGGSAGAVDRYPIWNDLTYEHIMAFKAAFAEAFAKAMGEAMAREAARAFWEALEKAAEEGKIPAEVPAIPGYELVVLIGVAGISSVILLKKRKIN